MKNADLHYLHSRPVGPGVLIQVLLNPEGGHQLLTNFLPAPKRVVINSATQRRPPTTSISRSAFPVAPNDWAVERYSGFLEEVTASRIEEI